MKKYCSKMKNKNQPKVSFIVPVYGVEKYIKRCIDSIINQTYHNYECIIVDDKTSDKSIQVIHELLETLSETQNKKLPYFIMLKIWACLVQERQVY